MKPIPQAIREKLLNRVKSASNGSEPHIRLIAKQTSVNTLLTEPIHEDISPSFGDVTVRQTEREKDISCAYAIYSSADNSLSFYFDRDVPAYIKHNNYSFPLVLQTAESEMVFARFYIRIRTGIK